MKKSNILIVVIIVAIIAIGGYALLHKPAKSTTSPSTNSSQNSNAGAVNNAVLTTRSNSSIGEYLADPNGNTLYTYGGDSSGVSNCTGACLASWPAYQDKGSTSNLPAGVGTIKRSDNGQTQFTYNGMPLYYFVSDSNGQVTGNNVSNFQVAKPVASSSSSTQSNSTSNSGSQSSGGSSGYPY